MSTKKLFDPTASDDNIRIIGGETTNLLNLENVKYKWAHDIFDVIYSNNWLPHKASMAEDKLQIKQLNTHENDAYEDLLSFLVFLDSIQTNNLPNIAEFITAPDVVYVLARQAFDEAIHSKSYGWILSSIYTHSEASKIVYKWRDNKLLLERNKFITNQYEKFIEDKNPKSFVAVATANYILEGLYFYNGFQFFHNLASRGLMIGTQTQIKYIQRDEIQHCNIFKNIIKETFKENPELKEETEEMVYEMFRKAVEWEIKFSHKTIGDNILGMTKQSITDYTHFLANRRLKEIGLKQIFPKVEKNPYSHLEKVAGTEDETTNRANNFEVTSTSYKDPSILDGWEDI